jgi:hypothetical protein
MTRAVAIAAALLLALAACAPLPVCDLRVASATGHSRAAFADGRWHDAFAVDLGNSQRVVLYHVTGDWSATVRAMSGAGGVPVAEPVAAWVTCTGVDVAADASDTGTVRLRWVQ